MPGNSNLHMSRAGRQDEFYTQLSTIEDELCHYREYFRDKIIFCNADDPAIGEDGQDHYGDGQGAFTDRKSTRLNSSHPTTSRMPSSA